MENVTKRLIQVALAVAVIWILAALFLGAPGASVRGPGFGVRIGRRKRRRGQWRKWHARNPYTWSSAGMVGGPLCQTPGSDLAMVGVPMTAF